MIILTQHTCPLSGTAFFTKRTHYEPLPPAPPPIPSIDPSLVPTHLLGPNCQPRAVVCSKHVLSRRESLLVVVRCDPQVLGGKVTLLCNQAVWVGHEWGVGERCQLVGDGGLGDGVDVGGVVELPDAAALRGDDSLGVVDGLQVCLHCAEAVAVGVGDWVCRKRLNIHLSGERGTKGCKMQDAQIDCRATIPSPIAHRFHVVTLHINVDL